MGKQSEKRSDEKVKVAYDKTVALVSGMWDDLSEEERVNLALNLTASMLIQVVRTTLEVGKDASMTELACMMAELGSSIGDCVREAYLVGSEGTCPCGECKPIDVTVTIRPVMDELNSTPVKPGTMLN